MRSWWDFARKYFVPTSCAKSHHLQARRKLVFSAYFCTRARPVFNLAFSFVWPRAQPAKVSRSSPKSFGTVELPSIPQLRVFSNASAERVWPKLGKGQEGTANESEVAEGACSQANRYIKNLEKRLFVSEKSPFFDVSQLPWNCFRLPKKVDNWI